MVIVCVIDLGSFSFARFNVTFEDAVKNERSAPPSALYIITGSMVLSIGNIECSFRATAGRFFELHLRRGAYRFLIRFQTRDVS